jgi:AraC-like DNA-binding protein
MGELENKIVCFDHHLPLSFEYTTKSTLKYIHTGQINYDVSGKLISAKAGNIVLIEGGKKVNTTIDKFSSGVAIFFEDALGDHIHDLLMELSIPLIDSSLKELLSKIRFDQRPDEYPLIEHLRSGLCDYVESLDHMISLMDYKRANTKLDILVRVLHARNIIEETYTRHLSIDDLAEKVAMSKYNLIRRFSRLFNYGPQHFLLRKRIRLAKDLIQNSNLSITEISLLCGYSNLYHFSKMFKKYTEHSPRQFRQIRGRIQN